MGFSCRQLEKLIDEIRQKNMSLDETYAAILKRWRDDEQAINALRDILARAEKTYGIISNESDVAAFIQFVLRIKWYAEKADRDFPRLVKLRREIKRNLPKERRRPARALSRGRISFRYAFKKMGELNRIVVDSTPPPSAATKTAQGFEPCSCGSCPPQCTRIVTAFGWTNRSRQLPA
jgi:sugar-specific transcriptional regulator TrmB